MDAVAPQRSRVGFWEAVLGGERLTDEPDGLRDSVHRRRRTGARPVLPARGLNRRPSRRDSTSTCWAGPIRPTWSSGYSRLGARHLDIGQQDVPWVVIADPETATPCCVMEDRAVYADTGPLAALPLDSADPDPRRDVLVVVDRLGRRARRRAPLPSPPVPARALFWSCAPSRRRRGRRRTGFTSTSGSMPPTIPTVWQQASPSEGGRRAPPRDGASCRGDTTRTRRATSSACYLLLRSAGRRSGVSPG